jgi:hypothetical protein
VLRTAGGTSGHHTHCASVTDDMKIDIDKLTEAELIDLNQRIVQRLRFLQQVRSHVAMLEFRLGERVEFQPEGQPLQTGVITRYNKTTVTIITNTGQRWNVAPQLLRRASESTAQPTADPNVVRLPKR